MTTSQLLLTGQTLDQLRKKFANPSASLKPLWDHFCICAKNNPFWFSSYNVFAFLMTGQDEFRASARDTFLELAKTKGEGLLANDVQFHAHTLSAPLGRYAILFDWVAETDLLSPDEQSYVSAALLDLAWCIPMQQLQGRARAFDNQIYSNAFGATLVGYVFGFKRGTSALARKMYEIGKECLIDQFRRLPRSGYSGEGSTYHELVVELLLLLGGIFLEETEGLPVYESGIAPSNSPMRDWLTMAQRIIGPEGILPGWDAYGTFHAAVKSLLIYTARREKDPQNLALVRDARMWYPMAHVSWEFDDRMWTLVFWPDNLDEQEKPFPFTPWMQMRL